MDWEKLREEIARKFLEYDFDRHGVKYGQLADEVITIIRQHLEPPEDKWKNYKSEWETYVIPQVAEDKYELELPPKPVLLDKIKVHCNKLGTWYAEIDYKLDDKSKLPEDYIEAVKKILEEYHYETLSTKDINDLTSQISQLFQKKVKLPILSDEEITVINCALPFLDDEGEAALIGGRAIAHAQHDLDAESLAKQGIKVE